MGAVTIKDVNAALAAYDGRQVMPLRALISVLTPPPEVMEHMIERCGDDSETVQSGATWLLKNFLEVGARLTPPQTLSLVAILPSITSWEACLHVCQSMRWLRIPRDGMEAVGSFIARCIDADEPFVRAWAYDALYQITRRDPGQMAVTVEVLQGAEDDPAPSVRARVKALLKACKSP